MLHQARLPSYTGAISSLALGLTLVGCGPEAAPCPKPAAAPLATPLATVSATPPPPTVAEADAFVRAMNDELRRVTNDADHASWVKETYITSDTEYLDAKAREVMLEFLTRKIKEAERFDGLTLPPETARALYLLRYSAGVPAPSNPAERTRLAELGTELESRYGQGKYCSPKLKGLGDDKKNECLTLDELNHVLAKSQNYEVLLDAWRGWHTISVPMRGPYAEQVALGNEGARELGFKDMSAIWKGGYDMSPDDFEREMARLWDAVRPLYEKLHCFVRARLAKKYGTDRVSLTGPIPAHLLGNMWAQEWGHLYPLLEPYPGHGGVDLTQALVEKKYDPKKMVETAEHFFVSLGMAPLPETFWQRSLFVKPRDREVECHASAWDLGLSGDLRVKMCIRVEGDDLLTIHHELGHDYYFQAYAALPPIFQAGANDGFHEGIGDTLALSVTPGYLKQIGLIDKYTDDPKADVNRLLERALDGIAFLPFGKLIDEWRWRVFDGRTPPANYNASYWELRKKYQGVAPPVPRSETDFDPGAKYHVAANVPYTRYFIARILQYQFHRALCRAAGFTGPLHQCSIYANAEAGKKLVSMLKLGASKPWADALFAIAGERTMDPSAILDYYAPLSAWLDEQNRGQRCGWD
jgi:peptidyl-dipeptidase A